MPPKVKTSFTEPDGFKAPPVIGYNDQKKESLEAVNRSKQFELDLAEFVKYVKGHDALEVDLRWVVIAITGFEQAFMALNRSIFKPDSPFANDPK